MTSVERGNSANLEWAKDLVSYLYYRIIQCPYLHPLRLSHLPFSIGRECPKQKKYGI